MNKRAFAWLFPLGAIAAVLSFPWPPPVLGVLIAIAIVAALVAAGLYFAGRADTPVCSPQTRVSALHIGYSLVIGLASGAVVVATLPLFGLEERMKMDGALPLWQRFVMSFNAAVLEEIAFRLFVVSLVTWLCAKFMRRDVAIWLGILAGAVTFGIVHLPRWMSFGTTTMIAVMIVNGAIAIVIGLVYVKWGIESAMTSHFGGDIAVHVAGPYFFT